jgi:transposase-like protein
MSATITRRVYRQFSDDFKLSVLKDYYESGKSQYFILKKYKLSKGCLQNWQRQYPLSEISVSLSRETVNRLESMSKKESVNPVSGSLEARIAELESENRRLKERTRGLQAALEYSELRVEAFSRAIKYYDEQEGVDILKKAGTRQQ